MKSILNMDAKKYVQKYAMVFNHTLMFVMGAVRP